MDDQHRGLHKCPEVTVNHDIRVRCFTKAGNQGAINDEIIDGQDHYDQSADSNANPF